VVALHTDSGRVGFLKPADTPRPGLARYAGGAGSQTGLTQSPTAVAVTNGGIAIVLEAGAGQLAAFDLNFHVARRMSRAAVPAMLDSGGGSLVHVGSDSGRLPEVGNQDYAAAKLALLALSKSLATEFSPRGIRSNVVVPGPTRTPLYDRPGGFGDQAAELWGIDKESAITRMVTQIRPLLTHKMGQPDDIAQVIAYLVSPLSRQVTAAEWTVDGGAQRQV